MDTSYVERAKCSCCPARREFQIEYKAVRRARHLFRKIVLLALWQLLGNLVDPVNVL
ncbi:hypothetical protein GGP65_001078 [Salinibacter ruber]|nr:hypothetical protein [Salinibacter ruber]